MHSSWVPTAPPVTVGGLPDRAPPPTGQRLRTPRPLWTDRHL